MKTPTVDRRVERTRQQLQDALHALILEHGYDAITVQNIIDRANVGRATFYAHFQDKESLLLSGFETLWLEFEQHFQHDVGVTMSPWDLSLSMFVHAHGHRSLYKAMAGERGATMILGHIRQRLVKLLQDHLKTPVARRKQPLPPDMLTQYVVASFIALLTWWLDHDSPLSPQQMNDYYRQLVEPGVMRIMRFD